MGNHFGICFRCKMIPCQIFFLQRQIIFYNTIMHNGKFPILTGVRMCIGMQYFNIESLEDLPSNDLLQLDLEQAETLVADELELLDMARKDEDV
mgnify:CR=1 FL=1